MAEQNESVKIQSNENDITLNSLQKVIRSMQEDLEFKEITLNNICKEKEQLLVELKKYKRANHNLKQQLEDERAFYLKEKEYYCREMSVTKKIRLKQNIELTSAEDTLDQIKEMEKLKKDLSRLKSVLNETLEANYNLSIKFLRMKNTKYSLKARLKREQTENAKIISNLTLKLEHTKEEILHIISDKFKSPIPPSNKKYLQVIKQNTQLIHDNLNYQIQISKLYNDIERIKAEKIKQETSIRLQYARKLKIQCKNSCDKICEANLCEECNPSSVSVTQAKPSNTTISSSNNQVFHLYSGTEFSLCQNMAMRTQSAPEFRQNEEVEDSEFNSQNT